MAKKLKKKSKVKVHKNHKQIAHLVNLLNISMGAVDGKSDELDRLFSNQAQKLRGQIEKLKENQ